MNPYLPLEMLHSILSNCPPNLDPSLFIPDPALSADEKLRIRKRTWKQARAHLCWFLSLRLVSKTFDAFVLDLLVDVIRARTVAEVTLDIRPSDWIPRMPFDWDPPTPSTMAMTIRLLDTCVRRAERIPARSSVLTKLVTATVETAVGLFSTAEDDHRDGTATRIEQNTPRSDSICRLLTATVRAAVRLFLPLLKESYCENADLDSPTKLRKSYRHGILALLVATLPAKDILQIITGAAIDKEMEGRLDLPDPPNATLMTAAYVGRIDHMKKILSLSFAFHFDLRPSLLAAAFGGRLHVMKFVMGKGVSLNTRHGPLEYSPLHLAAIGDKKDIIQFCIRHGADPNIWNSGDQTPLHLAAAGGHADVVRVLLCTRTVDPNVFDSWDRVPLAWAVIHGFDDVVRGFVSYKEVEVNIDDYNDFGGTIAMDPLAAAALWGQATMFDLLYRHLPDRYTYHDNHLLFCAIEGGDTSIVRTLVEKHNGIPRNYQTDYYHPLANAASYGHEQLTRYLLSLQGDLQVNVCKYQGTPLQLAIKSCHGGTVKALLEHVDVNVNCTSEEGKYDDHPLFLAVEERYRNAEVIKALLDHPDINPNLTNKNGRTPLGELVNSGRYGHWWDPDGYWTWTWKARPDLVKLFIDKENVNKKVVDDEGNTPLLDAAWMSKEIFLMLLPFYKDDIWLRDKAGVSVLEYAAFNDQLGIVARLLEPDLNVPKDVLQEVIERAQEDIAYGEEYDDESHSEEYLGLEDALELMTECLDKMEA
ncbi:ankyrin repeat domain-containing protein [Aspergillus mulundensis]|uniref:Uncharacterized protein n=1 Tax=Aspergillus mulundensis TaxID=1810919 RepID=A0A3D8SD53_9EURO|nr:hypothetical protein DSM5745_04417 [Aspergillus mulundensis]RDW84091.1 hypothetical protein DSM5745_04417 [Aspergillus mulundensis]